ncbi:nitroreductase family protein [Clostridium sp. UBA1056]|uniref:nitroreductase family protein n=1 Tax=unclassified Clostridium TaxID=2614128 RepID=UPI003216A4F9
MIKAIEDRRSIRKYMNKLVEDEKLLQILESARLAPSGSNTQPWQIIVVKEQENREKVAKASYNQKWMVSAPVHLVCVADIKARLPKSKDLYIDEYSKEFEVKQMIRDTSIAIEHMALTATDLGLGTCWIAWFEQKDFRPVLNIPEDKYVVAVLTLGYPDEAPNPRPRKSLEEIVHYEQW